MLAPADVGEVAGDQAQALAALAAPLEEGVDPVEQRLSDRAEAGVPRRERRGGDQHRIVAPPLRVEAGVEVALAQALRGKRHRLRAGRAQDRAHHVAGDGQAVAPPARHARDLFQRARAQPAHHVGEVPHVSRRHPVSVDDVERVVGARHVEPGDRAPRPAYRIEGAAFAALEPPDRGELGADFAEHRLALLRAAVAVAQDPERQRRLAGDPAAPDVDQLKAAAAEVGHDSVRPRHAGDHAEGRQPRLVLAAQHIDGLAAAAPDLAHEVTAVGRLAHRRGGDEGGLRHAHPAREPAEPGDRAQRPLGRLAADRAGGREVAAEPAGGALVEHRHRRAAIAVIDDEPHGVRPDIDHRHRGVGGGKAGLRVQRLDRFRCGHERFRPDSRDTPQAGAPESSFSSALPRPDRLGLVMKYSWALKACSVASARR